MIIREGGLDDPQVMALLRVHAAGMLAASPEESCHFLDLSGLRRPEISFWSGWEGEALIAIGAVKRLNVTLCEIKSMRTVPDRLRSGAGAQILSKLIAQARAMGMQQISLETGTAEAFAPAVSLYRKFGFTDCGPFGDYQPDPHSRFMTRSL